MSNNKKVDQNARHSEMERRKALEQLMEETAADISLASEDAKRILPRDRRDLLNYTEIQLDLHEKSQKIVNDIAEFYLGANIVAEVPYIRQKMYIDVQTVTQILFQMRTSDHAITKLLEEIDSGNIHARTFEVLGGLQKSKIDIVKHMTQFMLIMENAYKNLEEDYQMRKSITPTDDISNTQETTNTNPGFQTRGTRQLLQAIKQADDENKKQIEEINFEEINKTNVKK